MTCQIEVGKAHDSFRGLKFFLVEAEHKVDWDGPVVAVDTVGARTGDLVVVALAPFGPTLNIPADLPVEAAVVAIVRSLQAASGVGERPQSGAAPASAPAPAA
ncbi:MAG TPA: EutN/CcmL family microcompartment protein, partial [Planctomycetota bacterium]|nr:EutN/CcmL family microcompartment protein [Planctomycetota bacterium]